MPVPYLQKNLGSEDFIFFKRRLSFASSAGAAGTCAGGGVITPCWSAICINSLCYKKKKRFILLIGVRDH